MWTNPILHGNKSNLTHVQIKFQMWTNPISHVNKSNLTWEPIQFHMWTNSISHVNQSNFTCEQIQFHMSTNPILHVNKSSFTCEKLQFLHLWQKYSIHHFLIYSGIFFRIPDFFLPSQNFAIPNPDQPPYNLTWHIRFSKPKLNIFVDNISWYHTSKKGSLSIETKWTACARSKRDI